MTPADERRALAAWRDSAIGGGLQAIATRLTTALTESWTRRRVSTLGTDPAAVVQTIGYTVAVASITHAVFVRSLPAPSVGHIPLVTNVGFLIAGAVLAASPAAVVTAWKTSAARQLWARWSDTDINHVSGGS